MKKRKKGSSYIIVVIIMGILFTVSTGILTVTASDYKMRINESNRIRNLYTADSGLDVIENIIITASEKAIEYADSKVKSDIPTLPPAERADTSYLDGLFKGYFMNYLESTVTVGGNTYELLQYLVQDKQILQSFDPLGALVCNSATLPANVIINSYEKNAGEIIIKVQSTFETSGGQLANRKTIETKFIVNAPAYDGTVTTKDSTTDIEIFPVFDDKVITADGNLNATGSSTIKGNIWIKGNPSTIANPVYTFDKYRGGIGILDGSLSIDGNIYTANSVSLKNRASLQAGGKVYALNAYVGKENTGAISKDNVLNIDSDLIVNNDLSLNAENSAIQIKGDFYGINDTTVNATTLDKALNSSSIIVNSVTGAPSSLTVEGNAYIMGVSYLDATNSLGEKYQTGESVSVKGNYLAYTDLLPEYEGQVTLQYYNPLQLIEKVGGNLSLEEKAEYLKKYYEKNSGLNSGGINFLQDVYSVGAYIKNGIKYTGLAASQISTVNNIKNDYQREVFAMGDTTGVVTNPSTVVKSVATEIDFTKMMANPLNYSFNTLYGEVVLNDNSTNVIELENNFIRVKNNSGNTIKTINGVKGIIITNGDVKVKSGTDFTGNIIALGNVEIEDNSKLTYDANTTRNIIAFNYDELEPLFSGFSKGTWQGVTGEEISFTGSSEYAKDTYLKTSNWKIVK